MSYRGVGRQKNKGIGGEEERKERQKEFDTLSPQVHCRSPFVHTYFPS